MDSNNSILLNRKTSKRTVVFILIVVAVFIIVINLYGEKDPVVNVLSDRIEIEAMYGISINLTEIKDFSLLDESMNDIGVGVRTNGFGGIGGALKGSFRSDNGEMLLFVHANSAPTIRIQRENGPLVFISFSDSNKTMMLYNEILENY